MSYNNVHCSQPLKELGIPVAGIQMNVTVLTNPSIKAKGHRTLPTPVAPPRRLVP